MALWSVLADFSDFWGGLSTFGALKNAAPGCTAGRFCLGIEALRRHAVAGARFHSPSIAENLHRAELTLVARAEHIAASIRLTAAKAEAISPRVGEKLK